MQMTDNRIRFQISNQLELNLFNKISFILKISSVFFGRHVKCRATAQIQFKKFQTLILKQI